MAMMEKHEDKRRHPRFRAADSALAACGMEACALLDVSAGGLGIQYYGERPFPREISVDLLFLNRDLTLPGLFCRKVFEARKPNGKEGRLPVWHVGLEIVSPTPEMVQRLRHFRWTES
ncbi:MAG: PilZ domain-containing protein [bacterium]|nr:PilZ domain-containing protein [bacterium]MDT8395589.1 PilZ domain-containing protein [bacterium]